MKLTSAAIIDDEPLARRKLRGLLAAVDWIECVGEAADGKSAVELIDRLRPDLVFLDIRLPVLSGLDVLRKVKQRPAVIFTTAHQEHAAAAFDLAAADYLIKPFARARFLRALDRVRPALEKSAKVRAERLFVRDAGNIVPIRIDDVESLEARDEAVLVRANGRAYLLAAPLYEVMEQLDPARFVRVHRSQVVNLDHVVALNPVEGSRFQVRLRDGSVVTSSREGSRLLRQLGA